MHDYCRCVNYYFINFFSHLCALQSLLSTLFNLSSLTYSQHCLTTTQSPPPQPIITHDIPITKSTKNKEKSNQKSIQTQNQTFNRKLNNLEPKIKFQQKTHQPKPKLKLKLLSPLHGELVAFFARGELAATIREDRNKCLRAKTKEKIKKKKKNEEKRPWK